MPVSGPQWINRFPTSTSLDDLVQPFQGNLRRFLTALQIAGVRVAIADTLRPPQRAYLMHFAFRIAREGLDPATVPQMDGVDIQWLHVDSTGSADLTASKTAAEQMVKGFNIVFRPALSSRHTEGNAVDMNIGWENNVTVADGNGSMIAIASLPRTGGNSDMQRIGASYGVHKLSSDPPHWSSDGH